jgi:hypothetical protein
VTGYASEVAKAWALVRIVLEGSGLQNGHGFILPSESDY